MLLLWFFYWLWLVLDALRISAVPPFIFLAVPHFMGTTIAIMLTF
jgi:hypothetical protein